LAGRGNADEEFAPSSEELFSNENGERGSDSPTDDSNCCTTPIEPIEIGVVARPGPVQFCLLRLNEILDDIAVRVEDSDLRNGFRGKPFLPTRFTQQRTRSKHRRLLERLRFEQRRIRVRRGFSSHLKVFQPN
jgi:hypothetical protein